MYGSISGISNAAASSPPQLTQAQPSTPLAAPPQATIAIDDLGLPPAPNAGQAEDPEAFQSRQFERLQTIHTQRADALSALAHKLRIGAEIIAYTIWIPPFIVTYTAKSEEDVQNSPVLLATFIVGFAPLLLVGSVWMLERVAQSLRTESQTLQDEFQLLLTA